MQMNGQPTAQNTRESGCDGEFPAFRNWQNPAHVAELAALWNVEPSTLPHWHRRPTRWRSSATPRRARSSSCGSSAPTRPSRCPSCTGSARSSARRACSWSCQDAFLTETARAGRRGAAGGHLGREDRARSPTPTAPSTSPTRRSSRPARRGRTSTSSSTSPGGWTSATRTARRWSSGPTPEGAFEAWKACTRRAALRLQRLSYAKLRGGSGIQWPCNERAPRRAASGSTPTASSTRPPTSARRTATTSRPAPRSTPERVHGATTRRAGRSSRPRDYVPPLEEPDEEYPFLLTTGRVVYHFHTRTKTGRRPELQRRRPGAVRRDRRRRTPTRLGVADGDVVEVASRRGHGAAPGPGRRHRAGARVRAVPLRLLGRPTTSRDRAANELTLTGWDPVSKQPYFKYAAVAVSRGPRRRHPPVDGEVAPAPLAGSQVNGEPIKAGGRS